jgi:hypothetical protein
MTWKSALRQAADGRTYRRQGQGAQARDRAGEAAEHHEF